MLCIDTAGFDIGWRNMFIKPEVLQTSKSFMVIILMLCIRKLPRLIKEQFGSQSGGNVSQG